MRILYSYTYISALDPKCMLSGQAGVGGNDEVSRFPGAHYILYVIRFIIIISYCNI